MKLWQPVDTVYGCGYVWAEMYDPINQLSGWMVTIKTQDMTDKGRAKYGKGRFAHVAVAEHELIKEDRIC